MQGCTCCGHMLSKSIRNCIDPRADNKHPSHLRERFSTFRTKTPFRSSETSRSNASTPSSLVLAESKMSRASLRSKDPSGPWFPSGQEGGSQMWRNGKLHQQTGPFSNTSPGHSARLPFLFRTVTRHGMTFDPDKWKTVVPLKTVFFCTTALQFLHVASLCFWFMSCTCNYQLSFHGNMPSRFQRPQPQACFYVLPRCCCCCCWCCCWYCQISSLGTFLRNQFRTSVRSRCGRLLK